MTNQPWVVLVLVVGWFGVGAGWVVGQEKGMIYAHRGGAYEFEENTMGAFRGSYEKGIKGFETDVRMTKDGELVILHDDTLDRTYEATGPVETKTAAELRKIRSKKDGHGLLFLDELLEYFADKPGLYIEFEMKTGNKELYPDGRMGEYCKKVYETIMAKRPAGSFYVLTSFDERGLKIVKGMDAQADLLLITGGACTPEFVERAKQLGVKRVGCRMEGTSRGMVKEAQKAGLSVNGWPGQTLQDYHLAVGLGVDLICTDIPLAVQAYRAKGNAHP
jgi:glycerophosphoryl diester phosphodiesterase